MGDNESHNKNKISFPTSSTASGPPSPKEKARKKYNCKMQKRDVEGAVPYGFYIPLRYVVTRDVEAPSPTAFIYPLRYVETESHGTPRHRPL